MPTTTSTIRRALAVPLLLSTLAACEQRSSDPPRADDRSARDIAALAQRVTPLEQRANTLQGNVLFLSQQDESQRAQLAQTQQQLAQTQQQLAQTQQQLAQTQQQLAQTQAQVQAMQAQARSARRQVQGMMQQQGQQ